MKKRPWLAALLNVLLFGLGYIYVGKRKTFGWLLLIVDILSYVWVFIDANAYESFNNVWMGIASILAVIAFAMDAYQDAKSVNSLSVNP